MTTADVLLPMLAVDDNTFHTVEIPHPNGKRTQTTVPIHNLDRMRFLLRDPDRAVSAVPRNADGLPRRQGVLWVECVSQRQGSLLSRLPVPPSVILKDPAYVACTALWWLTTPLEATIVMRFAGRTFGEEANRRLARFVGAPMKDCHAEHLILARGVESAVPSRFSAKEVVGGLCAAPVARAWAA